MQINFQPYVDEMKKKKLTWNIFVKLMKDFFYSDIDKLKHINAILLTELTMSYSDMDRLKYLNVLLLKEFKNFILTENIMELTEDVDKLDEDFQNPKDNLKKVSVISETSNDSVLIQTLIQKENQMSDQESNESGQSKHNLKLFLCHICNEEYFISFHLKQHIRNVHEKQKIF